MKIEEIALMNAFWDRFDKSMENMFKAIQQENSAQRTFILDLVKAGSDATLKGTCPEQALRNKDVFRALQENDDE